MSVRPAHTTPGLISQAEYNARRWYEIGSTRHPFPQAYYGSHQDGCRLAYLAGVYARLFGVSLSPIG